MDAKQKAIQDIRMELKKQHRCFIAFHRELNPVIDAIVNNLLEKQQKKSKA